MNKASILHLIERGELETAVSQFVDLAKKTRHETLALQLSSRLADLKNAEFAGHLSFDERSRQRSQISHSLIQLVQQFDGGRAAGGSFLSKNWGKVGAAVVFVIGILANLGDIKQAFFEEKPKVDSTELPAAKPVEQTVDQTTHGKNSPNMNAGGDAIYNAPPDSDWEKAAQQKAKAKRDSITRRDSIARRNSIKK